MIDFHDDEATNSQMKTLLNATRDARIKHIDHSLFTHSLARSFARPPFSSIGASAR